eukprot:c9612_g1_i3.p1 GENE.c9612_g1_i3~~c9612_g1_i3.p1  ORF type:complete len:403 (+),score=74.81 c9612_g1_i3:39-1247(+)
MDALAWDSYVAQLSWPVGTYRSHLVRNMMNKSVIVYACAFSADGEWIVCGDSKGQVRAWNIASLDTARKDGSVQAVNSCQRRQFCGDSEGPVFAVQVVASGSQTLLITAGVSGVKAWRWSDVIALNTFTKDWSPERVCEFQPSPSRYPFIAEANAIAFDTIRNSLFIGAGDGAVYEWDLNTASRRNSNVVRQGHKGPVYCITTGASAGRSLTHTHASSVASGSEDGTVKLWDTRSQDCTGTIDVAGGDESVGTKRKRKSKRSPNHVMCVEFSLDGSWLVCGGTGEIGLRMFHASSLEPSVVFDVTTSPQAIAFHDNYVWCAGQGSFVESFDTNGDTVSQRQIACSSVFSLVPFPASASTRSLQGSIALCGASPTIDIFSAHHAAFSIQLEHSPSSLDSKHQL